MCGSNLLLEETVLLLAVVVQCERERGREEVVKVMRGQEDILL